MKKTAKAPLEQLLVSKRSAKPAPGLGKAPVERRQFLSYMKPDLIIELKTAAMEDERPAYELVEDAVAAYLKARKTKK